MGIKLGIGSQIITAKILADLGIARYDAIYIFASAKFREVATHPFKANLYVKPQILTTRNFLLYDVALHITIFLHVATLAPKLFVSCL